MKKHLLILFAGLTLFACNNPMDKTYSKATFEEDLKAIAETKKLDSTEASLLLMSFMSSELGGTKIEGKTYQQILDEAKARKKQQDIEQAKQEALAKAAKAEEEKRIAKLKEVLDVAIFDKGFSEYDYQEYLTYKFVFKNNADKEVRAFKGTLAFNDLFDTEIKRINLTYDEGISANGKINYVATTNYNQFLDEDVRLRSKDLKDIKLVWVPEKIIYTDGSTLE